MNMRMFLLLGAFAVVLLPISGQADRIAQCVMEPDGMQSVMLWNQGNQPQAVATALAVLSQRPFSQPAAQVLAHGLDGKYWYGGMWLDRMGVMLACFSLLLGILLLVATLWPRVTVAGRPLKIGVFVVLLSYMVLAAFSTARDRVVVMREVHMRVLPEPGANAVGRLVSGDVAVVRGRQQDYLLVEDANGSGWVAVEALIQVDRCL